MSSSNTKHNHHKYKDDNELQQWYTKSQTQLEQKMTDNFNKRIINSSQAINESIKYLIQNPKSNHIWIALFPNKSIDQYTNIFPLFKVSKTLQNNALYQLSQKVQHWAGVDIHSMNARPENFKAYYKRADNWWNRYKAEWLGTHCFNPLLKALQEYIISITDDFTVTSYNKSVTKQDEQLITQDLLLFTILYELLYTDVSFPRSKAQPLILDQSFEKSEELKQLFEEYGRKYSTNQFNTNWHIPPYDKKVTKNRMHIRDYARNWTKKLLTYKQQMYDKLVMQKQEYFKLKEPKKPPTPREMYNHYNIPPPMQYNVRMIHSEMKITKPMANINTCYLHAEGYIPHYNDGPPTQSCVTGNIQSHINYNEHMRRNNYRMRSTESYVNNNYNEYVRPIELPNDDAQTDSTYSTISTNYTRKPYRPFRTRGVSYKSHNVNINTYVSKFRYNPMKYYPKTRKYYNSNVSIPNQSTWTMPMNQTVMNTPITSIQNDNSFNSFSNTSIEDNYPSFDDDNTINDTYLNFNDDNINFITL